MRYVAILVMLALTLLGCGGSDSDTDTPTNTTVTTAAAGNGDTTTTSQPTTTTSGSNGDLTLANCPELLAWSDDWEAASQAAFAGGTGPTGFEYTADYFQEFADGAPDEIRADMQVIADALGGFLGALADLDVDFSDPSAVASLTPAQMQGLEDAAGLMDSDAVDEAAANIEAFFERECS